MRHHTFLFALKGAAFGLAAALILLLLSAILSLKVRDPDRIILILPHAARLLGGWAAGFAAARLRREKGLITGAIAGGILALFLSVGAVFSGGSFRLVPALLLCALVIAAGAVGGLCGLPGEKSGASRRRALHKRLG